MAVHVIPNKPQTTRSPSADPGKVHRAEQHARESSSFGLAAGAERSVVLDSV